MSDYTKLTAFDTKDALTTGDPLKRVKGTELDDEFDAISVAIATKANSVSPSLSGTPTAPTATSGTNTTQLATTAFVQAAVSPLAAKGSNSDITSLSGLTTALSVSQGGTGKTSATANNILLGNGTSALQEVAPGSSGNVLTSNGTTWASQAPIVFNWNVNTVSTTVSNGGTYNIPSNTILITGYIRSQFTGSNPAAGNVVIKDSGGTSLGTYAFGGQTGTNDGGGGFDFYFPVTILVPSGASYLLLTQTNGSNTFQLVIQAYVTK